MGNTMTATDLHRIASNALLFAGKNTNVSQIEVVRFVFSSNHVLSVATDRFMLGVTRADYTGEEFTVTLARADAERLAKLAKTAKSRGPGVRAVDITLHVGHMVTFAFSTGESVGFVTSSIEFPKWYRLLPETLGPEAISTAVVNPAKLAQFAKVIAHSDDARGLVINLQSRPAIIVTVGQHFVGLIMPVKHPSPEWRRPEWLPGMFS